MRILDDQHKKHRAEMQAMIEQRNQKLAAVTQAQEALAQACKAALDSGAHFFQVERARLEAPSLLEHQKTAEWRTVLDTLQGGQMLAHPIPGKVQRAHQWGQTFDPIVPGFVQDPFFGPDDYYVPPNPNDPPPPIQEEPEPVVHYADQIEEKDRSALQLLEAVLDKGFISHMMEKMGIGLDDALTPLIGAVSQDTILKARAAMESRAHEKITKDRAAIWLYEIKQIRGAKTPSEPLAPDGDGIPGISR